MPILTLEIGYKATFHLHARDVSGALFPVLSFTVYALDFLQAMSKAEELFAKLVKSEGTLIKLERIID